MRNDESFRNYGYEHLKKSHDAVAQIILDMYGMKPRYTYWGGESHGGRQALNVASHYASDFDGIVGVVPIGSYTDRQYAVNMREKIQMAPGAWVPPAKSRAIQMETLRLCDSLDGLADGVILNYFECNRRLDPRLHPKTFEHIRCANGADSGDDCLSDAQIATLDAFRMPMPLGFALANGETEVVGIPAGNGLQPLTARKPEPTTLPFTLLVQRHGNPDKYDMLKHDIADFKDDWVELSKWLDSPSDWSMMLAGRTKLILETAASDYTTNAVYTMQVYERAVKRSGQAAIDKSVRFYVTPNANHQNIGFSTTTGTELPRYVDLMGTLVNWVEKGVTPPDALMQTLEELNPPYKVLRSRPLCRYPQYPRYQSTDPDQAASYRCTAPRTGGASSE
jgi:feruloyl esterase